VATSTAFDPDGNLEQPGELARPARPARPRHRLFYLIAACHVFLLMGLLAVYGIPLLFGERIFVRVEPSSSPPLGPEDWTLLTYSLNRLPPQGIDGIADPARLAIYDGHPVYRCLEPDPDGIHWRGSRASFVCPADGKYLRGVYLAAEPVAPLRFGIEAYRVPRGKAAAFEKVRLSGRLSAEVAVTSGGQATLKGLSVK
jgi:hypothetical protein